MFEIKSKHAYFQAPANRFIASTAQRGAVTLMMSLIILIAITLLSLYSARTAVMEQRISSNEYRTMEVDQAASAGLEYGLIWLGTAGNSASWAPGTNPACSGAFDEFATLAGPGINAANSDTYALSIVFCRNTAVNNTVIQVASTATAVADASISKTVRVYTRSKNGPMNPAFSAAPLVFSGCLSNVNGNPDVWPAPGGIAIETKTGSLGCVDQGHLGLDGEGSVNPPGTISYSIPDPQDMWDYVFTMSRAEIQALAAAEDAAGIPDSQRQYVWITDPGNFHRSIGSPGNYAVVVFAASANCPKINGGPNIYGVVFVDSDCPSANGFGGADFYGSAVVNGNINKLNANTNFRQDNGVTALAGPTFPEGFAPKEIGTWSDF